MTCREWLLENGYEDVTALIDEAIRRIEAKGKKSRRNWWDTLAGGPGGRPLSREGIEFPVLRVAQIRQGKPVTENAIFRNENEAPPDVVATKRWRRKRLPSKLRKIAKRPAAPGHASRAS
jgi:hypothetical protein